MRLRELKLNLLNTFRAYAVFQKRAKLAKILIQIKRKMIFFALP